MRAPVLDRVKAAVDVEDRHAGAAQRHAGGLSRREFLGANGFHLGILWPERAPGGVALPARRGVSENGRMKAGPVRTPSTVDDYIAGFPSTVQSLLKKVRRAIRKAAPLAEESISYRIAAYRQAGTLIFFAGFRNHIGLYPAPCDAPGLKKALAPYRSTKSTARFALDQPIPYALIEKVTRFRLKENLARAAAKNAKKSSARKAGRRRTPGS